MITNRTEIMSKETIRRRIFKRLDTLYAESNLFNTFINYFGDEENYCWSEEWESGETYELLAGASRFVVVFYDFDYVVKFDYSNWADSENYNNKEMRISYYAECEGISDFFAETWYGGEFRGMPFTLMKKADTNCTKICSDASSNYYVSEQKNYDEQSGCFDLEEIEFMVNLFRNYYSEEKVIDFLDFCIDNGISDIYENNVGYINGLPVLIDYAGYWG